ncbi:DNRLRE domain-containing protein [Actinoplanes sp. NBRC 103695]|uniref:DNRLRE domain-containing protein n=1 Tax=Actinoplanes sp. NBRC 103695 TaxID=3032202 RepID=UPI0025561EBD|nr:DNRLRE domain-containing protein [Actinoplanes sp. NBRC 103695]
MAVLALVGSGVYVAGRRGGWLPGADSAEPGPATGASGTGVPPATGRNLVTSDRVPAKLVGTPERPVAKVPLPAAKVVKELIDQRAVNIKRFLLKDGRVQDQVSAGPRHYRDSKGRWQNIDTRIKASDRAGYPAANTTNSFVTHFGGRTDRLLTFDQDGRRVSIGLDGPARAVRPTIKGSTATFAVDGVEYAYTVTPTGLKNDIRLRSAPAVAPAYRFVLDLRGVGAVAQPDGSIAFAGGDGPPLFYLPKPFMYDAKDDARGPYGKAYTDKVTQTLTTRGAQSLVTITPDAAWLKDAARKYPVVVDPTVKIQPTTTQSQDAMITSDEPAKNFDGNWRLSVGTTTSSTARSLLRFDLSRIPAGTTLDSAQLRTWFDQTHTTDAANVEIGAYRVTAPWTENTVTWNSINGSSADLAQNSTTVDNSEANRTSFTGEWTNTTGAGNGGGYRLNNDTRTGDTFTWVPRLTEAGVYTVEAYHVGGSDRATNAPFTVHHAGGTATVNVNQTGGGNGAWTSLGTYSFTAGTTHKVVLRDVAGKAVVADAVRFIKRGTDVKKKDQVNAWHNFSVRDTVQNWLDGTQANNGFMLKATTETANAGGPRYEAAEYAYNGEIDQTPKLLLTYGKPGVELDAPMTIRSTGADLTWAPYANDDFVEYQIHRSIWQHFLPTRATLVAPVKKGLTAYNDTSAEPTPASSPEPFGNAFYYQVAVKLRDGSLLGSQSQLVRLPKAGRVVKVIQGDARDTTLSSTESTTGHDVLQGSPWLSVGNNSTTYGKTRAVVKFPSMNGVPTGARVLDAKVSLWGFYTVGSGATYQLHELTRDFDEGTASWNRASSASAWTAAGGDIQTTGLGTVTQVTNDPAVREFDADALVQKWIADPTSNKGALIKLADEAGPQERTLFLSGEGTEPALHPKLKVVYADPAGTYYAPTVPNRMIPGDEYSAPVTVANTTDQVLKKDDWVLSYHWETADGRDVTTADNRRDTALTADLNRGDAQTLTAKAMTPARQDTANKRESFVLKWDLRRKATGQWLSQTAQIPPLAQEIAVEDPTSDQLGLEKFYQYGGSPAGAGSNVLVNQFGGNAVFSYDVLDNPSRGLNTFVRLTYNSQDTSNSYIGYGWSLSTSSIARLGSPLRFTGGTPDWPEKVDLVDGDGTTNVFQLNKHNSTKPSDWDYDHPKGVHLYFQRTGDEDPTKAYVMTRPDRTKAFFDTDGYQTAVIDNNGNELNYTYERTSTSNLNTGVLKYITDSAGRRTLSLDYYAQGDPQYDYFVNNEKKSGVNLDNGKIIEQLKSITDVNGRTVTFTYSNKGLLQLVVDGEGDSGEKPFQFWYDDKLGDGNPKLVRVDDPRGNPTVVRYYDTNDNKNRRLRAKAVVDREEKETVFDYLNLDGDANKQITSTLLDAQGRLSTFLIDGFGRPTLLTNAKGEKTELHWDADNNVDRLTEDNGATTTWAYDPKTGYPTEIRDAEANADPQAPQSPTRLMYRTGLKGYTAELIDKISPEGRHWVFGYDDFANLVSVTDPKGVATDRVEGDYTTTYTYDRYGQMESATDANEKTTLFSDFEPVGYPKRITDPLKNVTTYTYDVLGNVTSVEDARKKKSTYEYDLFGRPRGSKVPKDQDKGAYIITPGPSYDRNDNVYEDIRANGAKTTATHDSMDRIRGVMEPPDTEGGPERRSTYEYDNVGNLVWLTEPKGNASADPDDYRTRYVYDELNRVLQMTDAKGGKVTYTYDKVGNLKTVADQRKNETADPADANMTYEYDRKHQVTAVIDADGNRQETRYDGDGNPIVRKDQDGNETTTVLDERAKPIEQRVPHSRAADGKVTYRTTRFGYDEVGNRTKVETPRGVETEQDENDFSNVTVYDAMNRVKEQIQPYDVDDSEYKTPEKTTYEYDEVGRVKQVSSPPSGKQGQDKRINTTHEYFDNGWVKSSTDEWNIKTTYDYDALGAQTSRKVTGGDKNQSMTTTYYPDGKKKSRTDDGDGAGQKKKSFAYSYDLNGNVTEMRDTSSDAKIDQYVLAYDQLNRVEKIEEKKSGATKNTTSFTYFSNGLTKTRTHDKQFSEFNYNPLDLAAESKVGTSSTDPKLKVTKFTYTKRHEVKTETKANGNVVTKDYYLDGKEKHQVEKKNNDAVVNEHSYEYNPNGHRSKDVAHKQNADNNAAFLDTTTENSFDPLDRIRKVTKTGHGATTEEYDHDANNNVIRQKLKDGETNFTYDRNRVTRSTTDGIAADYTYDDFGRMEKITSQGIDLQTYKYDSFNRVTSASKFQGGTTEYTYDPLDRQASRKKGSETTEYGYLGTSEKILSEEVGGQLKKSYQYSPSGQLLSQTTFTPGGQEDAYLGYNAHEDVEQLTDDKGNSKSTYGYTAYGKDDDQQFTGIDKPSGAQPGDPAKTPYNAYRFNAKRFDEVSGDYNMGFRNYNPGLNRFLSRDYYNGALADLDMSVDPFTNNRYAFAGGNPVTNIEIDGHFSLGDIGDKIKEGVDKLKNVAKDAVGAGGEAAKGAAQSASDKAGKLWEQTKDKANKAIDKGIEKGKQLGDDLGAIQSAGEGIAKQTEKWTDAAKLKDPATDMAGKIGRSKAWKAAGPVGDIIGGGLGFIKHKREGDKWFAAGSKAVVETGLSMAGGAIGAAAGGVCGPAAPACGALFAGALSYGGGQLGEKLTNTDKSGDDAGWTIGGKTTGQHIEDWADKQQEDFGRDVGISD